MAITLNGTTGITTPGLIADSPTLTVDSANNRVGINTTAPANELEVWGTGTVALFSGSGGSGFIGIHDRDDGTLGFIGVDGGTLKFQTPGSSYSDKLVITSAGNVGIGTNNPGDSRLFVNNTFNSTYSGSAYNDDFLLIKNSSTIANTAASIYMIASGDGNSAAVGTINLIHTANGGGDLSFQTRYNGGMGERLRITSNGRTTIYGSANNALTVYSQSSSDNHSIAYFKGNDDVNQAGLHVRYYQCGSDDNRSGLYWQHENVGNMRMWMGDDLRLRMQGSNPTSANTGNAFVQEDVSTTNNIKMGSGYGIDFSATSNAGGMTSELLDDYEEGTWTPSLTFNGVTTGITYTTREGYYTKIGNIVNIQWHIVLSNKGSATGNAVLGGNPFSAFISGGANNAGTVAIEGNGSSWPAGTYSLVWSDGGIYVRHNGSSSWSPVTNSNFTNTTDFYGSNTYHVS